MSDFSNYTDDVLLSLLKGGDESAFTEIYNRYWERLLAIAFSHTKNKSVAKDIVQNLFVGLWNRKEKLEIDNLEHYLATAIKFAVFKEYYRKQKREANLKEKLSPSEDEEIEQKIHAKFLEQYIYGLIEQLPPKCRLVFESSRIRQMSIDEIALEMGISPKTAEAHLTKALKTLKHQLRGADLVGLGFLLWIIK